MNRIFLVGLKFITFLLGIFFSINVFANKIMSDKDITEKNKKNVIQFYDLMFNKSKPSEAVSKFVGEDYIQHNPLVGTGKKAFIKYFEEMALQYPTKHVNFRRVLGEKNFVILHCEQFWPGDKNPHWAGIDIFRLDKNGKIIEHWDVLQPVPKHSLNNNSMF